MEIGNGIFGSAITVGLEWFLIHKISFLRFMFTLDYFKESGGPIPWYVYAVYIMMYVTPAIVSFTVFCAGEDPFEGILTIFLILFWTLVFTVILILIIALIEVVGLTGAFWIGIGLVILTLANLVTEEVVIFFIKL